VSQRRRERLSLPLSSKQQALLVPLRRALPLARPVFRLSCEQGRQMPLEYSGAFDVERRCVNK
jgi:hypothetical protein